jgi:hypothetical protein
MMWGRRDQYRSARNRQAEAGTEGEEGRERSSPVGMAAVRDAAETGFTCWRRKERGQAQAKRQ